MKTKIKIKRFGLVAIAAAAIVSGCISDGPIMPDVETPLFTASLPPAATVSTRATTGSADENMIGRLSVLLFDAGGNYIEAVACTGLTPRANNTEWTFRARIPFRDHDPYDLLFVANVDMSKVTLTEGMTRAEVQTALVQTKGDTEKWAIYTTGSIPMFGELKNQTVSEGYSSPTGDEALRMRRMLSRVNVTVHEDARAKFKLTDVRVFNHTASGNVIPGGVDPSIPAGATPVTTGDGLAYSTSSTDIACEGMIYLFEGAAGTLYPAPGWQLSPCIVVGGKYDNSPTTTWYRLDFIGNSGTVALPVVRNTSYNFSITSVSGKGYSYPTEARDSAPANMAADILSWDDDDLDNIVIGEIYDIDVAPAIGGTALANNQRAYEGMAIKVSATPDTGMQFVGWNFTGQPIVSFATATSANPVEFTMPAGDVTVAPVFSEIPVVSVDKNSLTFAAKGGVGQPIVITSNSAVSVSVSGDGFRLNGSTVAVEATAPTAGNPSKETTVEVTATDFTGDLRTGRIEITTLDVTPAATASVDLIQSAFIPELSISQSDEKVWLPTESAMSMSEPLTVTVTANTTWSVDPNPNFNVFPIGNTGIAGGSFTVIPKLINVGSLDRTAIITVRTTTGQPQVVAMFPVRQQAPFIDIVPTEVPAFPATGYSPQTFTVSSNLDWRVSTTGDFTLTSGTNYGKSGGVFSIAPSGDNTTPSARQGTIAVLYGTANEVIFVPIGSPRTFAVTQLGSGPNITTSAATLSFGAGGGEQKSFTITSNDGWTVSTTDPTPFIITPELGNATGAKSTEYTVTTTANPGNTPRNLTLTFTNGTQKVTVTLSQEGDPGAILDVVPTNLTFPARGGIQTIAVASNVSYTVSLTGTDAEKFRINSLDPGATHTSSGSTGSFTVSTIGANNSNRTYTATVTIQRSGGDDATQRTFSVNQDSFIFVESITIGPESMYLEAGDTATLSAVILPENATEKSVTWSTSDDNIATISSSGVITAFAAGEITIIATSRDGTSLTSTKSYPIYWPISLGDPNSRSNILYLHGSGDDAALGLSTWGDVRMNKENYLSTIAYFKWGSVVGMNNDPAFDDAFDGTSPNNAVRFNPTSNSDGWFEYNDIPYETADTPNPGLDDVAYTSLANVRAGRGDPCRLVGLTIAQIRSATTEQWETYMNNSEWRMPSLQESSSGRASSTVPTGGGLSEDDPYLSFSFIDDKPLPGAGGRYGPSGNGLYRGEQGHYWTRDRRDLDAYYLQVNNGFHREAMQSMRHIAKPIRCVPK